MLCIPGDTIMFLEKSHSVRKPNKRLQKAFRVIYFVVSLAKKVIANGKNTQFLPKFLPSPSYVAIDIQAIDHKPLIDIDQKALSEIHGPTEGWYDGASIIVATILVVVVSAISNFRQSRQFDKLSDESSDQMKVEVVRNGRKQPISIFEVVVGDIVCLNIGDQVPVDGLFLDGDSLKVDKSSMTSYIGKVGLLVAFLVPIVLLIRYFIGNTEDKHRNQEFNCGKTKANDVINVVVRIVVAAVTIVVVAILEGLPLAVTLWLIQ
ncbi:putative calcium-transporting ATPase 13, plasma membrane-type [Camellia lanceoleosa]|uniref:Calcium-transporting ATPase 13, plasma membrane-type n=1 Tax=Camellia lanceoleosa TaxID=1840588 RepID=A0ACC0I8X3_9ERIC|nr:putative calcium-transporting ATPase 13, plasma membrane-type [Camellia lanceoleosa]